MTGGDKENRNELSCVYVRDYLDDKRLKWRSPKAALKSGELVCVCVCVCGGVHSGNSISNTDTHKR